ncbi:hypothetical protein HRbin22_01980 [Candidatus Thermoflexus japonica]|uniref:HEPN domain-containing protein n=1 Tax=Candidatus Thermoflexus japonica TaxID=2035417 RepID=A0A2H5Y8H0_9CHLR|nr:hypothetical protein HRbin22_01980 [Candidatus Thermoflexus japonica]
MGNRAMDWFRQAERDLEQAEDSRRAGRHEWACFAAQQAAEKAVKALHRSCGQEAWGHGIARLLQELPDAISVPPDLIEKARVLDNFYIPPRYPNSYPAGAPFCGFVDLHARARPGKPRSRALTRSGRRGRGHEGYLDVRRDQRP